MGVEARPSSTLPAVQKLADAAEKRAMERQHTENLFRRFKGQVVTIKTVSGGVYEGRIAEITNDYACLVQHKDDEPTQVFVFFTSLESMMLIEVQPA